MFQIKLVNIFFVQIINILRYYLNINFLNATNGLKYQHLLHIFHFSKDARCF